MAEQTLVRWEFEMYNQDDPELVVRKAKTVKLHVGDLNFTHKHLAAVSKRFLWYLSEWANFRGNSNALLFHNEAENMHLCDRRCDFDLSSAFGIIVHKHIYMYCRNRTARNLFQRVAADSWFDMFYMHDRVWFFKVCLKADPGLLLSNVRCPLSNDMWKKYTDGRASFDIGLGAIGLSNGIAMDFPPTFFSDGSFSRTATSFGLLVPKGFLVVTKLPTLKRISASGFKCAALP